MPLVYAEFEPHNKQPSMSDEEIKILVEKYRHEKHCHEHNLKITQGSSKKDTLEFIDEKYEETMI